MAHSAQNFPSSLLPKKVISKLYKTLLARVLCGLEIWSFILRIGHRLGVLRTMGGGEIIWSLVGKMVGRWREFDGGRCHSFYSSTNIIAIEIKYGGLGWVGS